MHCYGQEIFGPKPIFLLLTLDFHTRPALMFTSAIFYVEPFQSCDELPVPMAGAQQLSLPCPSGIKADSLITRYTSD